MDIVDAFEFIDEECFDYNEMDDVDVINTGGGVRNPVGENESNNNMHLRLERMKKKRKAAENAMKKRMFFHLVQ